MTCPKEPISLTEVAQNGQLQKYVKRYLKSCKPDPNADPKKNSGRFPNYAGFCRWLGCGISEVDALRISHPEAADWLNAVMEDEALNNSALLSPTVLNAYLKRRLGYGTEGRSDVESETDCGLMRLVFEHDVEEDGE